MTPGSPINPQILVDLCTVEGWAAVHVSRAQGSTFEAGHVQVFYKTLSGEGHSRMFYADTRCLVQIAELRQNIKDEKTIVKYKATTRFSHGFTDPRGIFGLSETKQEGTIITMDHT